MGSAQPPPIQFTILELENLSSMGDFCKRWYGHEYARTAIVKIDTARRDYFAELERAQAIAAADDYDNRPVKGVPIPIKIKQ